MRWFKCKSCGYVVSEQQLAELTRQAMGGGEIFGSIKYETCRKCGACTIELAEPADNPSIRAHDILFKKGHAINPADTYKNMSSEKLLQLKKEGGLTPSAASSLDKEIRRRNLDSHFVEETYRDINKMNKASEKSKLHLKRILGVFLILFGILCFSIFLLEVKNDFGFSLIILLYCAVLLYFGIRPWMKKAAQSGDHKASERQPLTTSIKHAMRAGPVPLQDHAQSPAVDSAEEAARSTLPANWAELLASLHELNEAIQRTKCLCILLIFTILLSDTLCDFERQDRRIIIFQ